jgi:hypothetical protein
MSGATAISTRTPLQGGQLIVVPQNTWHRFESAKPVKGTDRHATADRSLRGLAPVVAVH